MSPSTNQSDRSLPVGCSQFGLITVCPRLKHSLTAPQRLQNIFICRLHGVQSRLLRLLFFISPSADLKPSSQSVEPAQPKPGTHKVSATVHLLCLSLITVLKLSLQAVREISGLETAAAAAAAPLLEARNTHVAAEDWQLFKSGPKAALLALTFS